MNLQQADLQGAYLAQTDLQGANLNRANLRGASLFGANLQRADLSWADLQGTDIHKGDLRDADLARVKLSPTTNLEGVTWDPKYINVLERRGDYEAAITLYRQLKRWYEEAGMLTIAGEFHYREREAARKLRWRQLVSEVKVFKRNLGTAWQKFRGREDGAS